MTQEQAKDLMDKMDFPAFNQWGYELMLKFYQAAQKEAYERAAQVCDAMGDEYDDANPADCAEAIRKLSEEV